MLVSSCPLDLFRPKGVFVCVNENKTQENSSRSLGHSNAELNNMGYMISIGEGPNLLPINFFEALHVVRKIDFRSVDSIVLQENSGEETLAQEKFAVMC